MNLEMMVMIAVTIIAMLLPPIAHLVLFIQDGWSNKLKNGSSIHFIVTSFLFLVSFLTYFYLLLYHFEQRQILCEFSLIIITISAGMLIMKIKPSRLKKRLDVFSVTIILVAIILDISPLIFGFDNMFKPFFVSIWAYLIAGFLIGELIELSIQKNLLGESFG